MKNCLRDRTLLLIHYGEGRAEHVAHLEACARCAPRYRRLVRDLELIGHALGRMPGAITVRRRSSDPSRRRVAVAAVLAVGVVVTGVEVWLWRETRVLIREQPKSDEADTLRFLAEVSAALPALSDEEILSLPLARDLTDPETVLEEGGEGLLGELEEACEGCDALDDGTRGGYGNENT